MELNRAMFTVVDLGRALNEMRICKMYMMPLHEVRQACGCLILLRLILILA